MVYKNYLPKILLIKAFPTLRSRPALDIGIPVFRDNFCLTRVIPIALFHENDSPGIFMHAIVFTATRYWLLF